MAQSIGILFVDTSLGLGGAEHALLGLVEGLVADGRYNPIVACLREPGPLAGQFEKLGIPVHSRVLRDKYDLLVLRRLVRIIRGHRVRVVVCVGAGGDRMLWGTLAARIAGARVVVWSHTFSQPGHPELWPADRVIYPLVDKFIALGRRHKQSLARRDKVPPGRTMVMPYGVDIPSNGHPLWRDRARAILGLADENILAVGMIANLRPSKRHDIFIEAARRVVGTFRDVHFFIIGDGPNRQQVRALAGQSELLGRYLSLLGHRDDVPALLPGLDLVCVCSEFHECQSLVALQAMAAGVPVVSNDIGAMDEVIADNATGFFYRPLTAQALAQRILDVVPQRDLRQCVAEAAKKHIAEKYTRVRLVTDFIRLFDDLLINPHRRTRTLAILSRILSSDPQ